MVTPLSMERRPHPSAGAEMVGVIATTAGSIPFATILLSHNFLVDSRSGTPGNEAGTEDVKGSLLETAEPPWPNSAKLMPVATPSPTGDRPFEARPAALQ